MFLIVFVLAVLRVLAVLSTPCPCGTQYSVSLRYSVLSVLAVLSTQYSVSLRYSVLSVLAELLILYYYCSEGTVELLAAQLPEEERAHWAALQGRGQ